MSQNWYTALENDPYALHAGTSGVVEEVSNARIQFSSAVKLGVYLESDLSLEKPVSSIVKAWVFSPEGLEQSPLVVHTQSCYCYCSLPDSVQVGLLQQSPGWTATNADQEIAGSPEPNC